MGKINLYFNTIRYLKLRQIVYQLFYRMEKSLRTKTASGLKLGNAKKSRTLILETSIPSPYSYLGNNTFKFLNNTKTFDEVDWNYRKNGKLWSYNLNYFDYLLQPTLTIQDGFALLDSFCESPNERLEGNEPYPISLRGINWIKFFSYRGIHNQSYDCVLYASYRFLGKHIEYHLMGNHLLENGFSMLFGAYYFKDDTFYEKAKRILFKQLEEQLLDDGGHFELSPMYHQILLFRLLDCINLVKNNFWKDDSLLNFLRDKAQLMMGWLNSVSFANGDVPMVNDSAFGIAPSCRELLQYSNTLGLTPSSQQLSDSGYRMLRFGSAELFIDIGKIGPDYIPGHAHSDTFSFVLYVNSKPFIVDCGTSTYETNDKRIQERSTRSHNTVQIDDKEQTEIWGSFRVGRRAEILSKDEKPQFITATHNGYKNLGAIHRRTWEWDDLGLSISDEIEDSGMRHEVARAFLHFHPTVVVNVIDGVIIADDLTLRFEGQVSLSPAEYDFAQGFNKTVKATVVTIEFEKKLRTSINISTC